MNRPPRTRRRGRRDRGFTLVELLVVVTIIGLIGQIVVFNIGALLPSTSLDSQAKVLMNRIEFLRSEAQLKGETYKIELDLDRNVWRILLPQEERLTSDQVVVEEQDRWLGWNALDDRVRFHGFALAGSPTVNRGRVQLVIDERGFSGDQCIFLSLIGDTESRMIWTIQIRGLDRRTKLLRDQQGQMHLLPLVEEASF